MQMACITVLSSNQLTAMNLNKLSCDLSRILCIAGFFDAPYI